MPSSFGEKFLAGYQVALEQQRTRQREELAQQHLALERQRTMASIQAQEKQAKAQAIDREQADLKLKLLFASMQEGPPGVPVSPEAGGVGPDAPGQREVFEARTHSGGRLSTPALYRPELQQQAIDTAMQTERAKLGLKREEAAAPVPLGAASREAIGAPEGPLTEDDLKVLMKVYEERQTTRRKAMEEGGQESRFLRTPVVIQGTDEHGNPMTTVLPRNEAMGKTFKGRTSSGERLRVKDADAALASAQNLGQLYNQDWVGPVAGRAYSLQEKIPGVEVDPLRSEFVAQNTALKNATIKFITGAQMSEPEARRIMKQVPDVTDKPLVWEAKYKATLNNMEILRRIMSGDISQKEGLDAMGLPPTAKLKLGAPQKQQVGRFTVEVEGQ